MAEYPPLQGACSCGRNHYLILVPKHPNQTFQILLDDASENSHGLSLRAPLSTIQSTTRAFYPDENHTDIRRVFTPAHAPHTKRHFCGFCGTPLSHWSEEPPTEAEYVNVNLGSLKTESLERLQEHGLLDPETNEEEERAETSSREVTRQAQTRELRGSPWFEEMIAGSELGRVKRRRGGQTSTDGTTSYEWEVVETDAEEEDTGSTTSKRKHRDLAGEDEDTEMRST
ncbi:uncharacterized protein KY384_001695 [Bacidia gigantensis]|uniref:uncharacterized protein n=1 Tax=Bacidia gigantensis TaxID=2732470 RepID=UPI001D04ADCF|nr:uncharacterized protein KY384_001695 [Bacidia gigantensis]KAG8533953.1 hypothetical protein KY384_001695 [Bacidia gigantensis]